MDFLSGLIFLSPDLSCRDTSRINPQSTTTLPPPHPKESLGGLTCDPERGLEKLPPRSKGHHRVRQEVFAAQIVSWWRHEGTIFIPQDGSGYVLQCGGGSNRLIATKVSGVTLRRAALALRYGWYSCKFNARCPSLFYFIGEFYNCWLAITFVYSCSIGPQDINIGFIIYFGKNAYKISTTKWFST